MSTTVVAQNGAFLAQMHWMLFALVAHIESVRSLQGSLQVEDVNAEGS